MILKNRTVQFCNDGWGKISMNIYKEGENGVLEYEKNVKIEGMEGVDIEVSVPKFKRTEYGKIIKIKE